MNIYYRIGQKLGALTFVSLLLVLIITAIVMPIAFPLMVAWIFHDEGVAVHRAVTSYYGVFFLCVMISYMKADMSGKFESRLVSDVYGTGAGVGMLLATIVSTAYFVADYKTKDPYVRSIISTSPADIIEHEERGRGRIIQIQVP